MLRLKAQDVYKEAAQDEKGIQYTQSIFTHHFNIFKLPTLKLYIPSSIVP